MGKGDRKSHVQTTATHDNPYLSKFLISVPFIKTDGQIVAPEAGASAVWRDSKLHITKALITTSKKQKRVSPRSRLSVSPLKTLQSVRRRKVSDMIVWERSEIRGF